MGKKPRYNGNVIPLDIHRLKEDKEYHSLLDAGKSLTSEHETAKILDMILDKAIENTNADGGSIYLIERVDQDSLGGEREDHKFMLSFYQSSNRSIDVPKSSFSLNLDDSSIAGYVAVYAQSLRINDCYEISSDKPYNFNVSFDEATGYRTKTMLAVPIVTSKGKVIGVVQLVNKLKLFRRKSDNEGTDTFPFRMPKEEQIVAFSNHDLNLIESFAAHAGVALENAKLTEDISRLFESFVKASVTAIEARDPSTSGHSDRVALLTCGFAEKVDRLDGGIYKSVKFTPEQYREMRYAALLHDFGKIGVNENVLLKNKKLYPNELETILLRIESMQAKFESHKWKSLAQSMVNDPSSNKEKALSSTLFEVESFYNELQTMKEGILKANEPQVLEKDFDINKLIEWIEMTSSKLGSVIISPDEKLRLSLERGNLSTDERKEIESHVEHTYQFLKEIAWTDDLSSVPEIAHAHHEKLDGSGYPRRLEAAQIPVQARIMTISDIYDALTAMDRPYKKAVSEDRAIEILGFEAKAGKICPDLLKVFIEAGVFQLVRDFKKKAA